MQCSGCNQENREGARFCEECGRRLERVCGGCGGTISKKAKFCDSRGEPVVWVVQGDVARRLAVRTAGDAGLRVRIADGLEGDEIVLTGEAPDRDGTRVQPIGPEG